MISLREYLNTHQRGLTESSKYDDIIRKHLDKCTAVLRYNIYSISFGIKVDSSRDIEVFRIIAKEDDYLNDRMSNYVEELAKELEKLGFRGSLSGNEYISELNYNKVGNKILETAKKFTEKLKKNNPKADITIIAESLSFFEEEYFRAYDEFLARVEKDEGSEFIDRVYRHKGTTKPLSKEEREKEASDYFAKYYRDNKWTGD